MNQPNAADCVGPPAPRSRWRWRWRRTLTLSAVGSLVAFGLNGGITSSGPWSERLQLLAICAIYGNCIGLAAAFAIPGWLRRVSRRGPAWWLLARLMALPLGILIGGGAGAASLVLLGLIPRARYLDYLFPYLRSGPAVAFVFTIFLTVTSYEYLRNCLDAASLALTTKQRDEAEARRLAAEAQLASLESRVQPHFLFNTLNSIAALIPDDAAGAERMTTQLASLMRSSLATRSSALVPLDEELRVVRDYLEIERVRFGERLRYDVRVSHRAAAALVPRLSLQTLVENSVKYAVSPRREGATVAIAATESDGRVSMSVEDDGPGF